MRIKSILTVLFAGAAMSVMAQTHVEGVEYYRADQFKNAKELLTRNMNNAGTDKATTDYYLGLIALQEGNKAEAQKYFTDGVAANADYGYNYIGLGQILLSEGNEKEAEKNFKDGEKLEDKSASSRIAIARAYYSVDPVKYAKQIAKYVADARKKDLKNPDIYLFEGDQLMVEKDWGGAGAKYEMATSYAPNASEAYVKYANLYTMVNPQYAVDMLNKLLEVNPNSALGQRELANALYNKKDYKAASAQYEKYVENPNHFKQDEDRLAFLLFFSGDYQKGYDFATKLLQADPKNFTAQRFQFMNAAQLPDMKEQLLPLAEALLAAHKANPAENKFAAIDYNLISSELASVKRTDEAIQVLNDAIKEMPDNANLYKQLADVYVRAADLSGASDAFQKYLSMQEDEGYNDLVQLAIYAYYAGRQHLNDADNHEASNKYFNLATEKATKASEMAPAQYKPVKILADIAVASAPTQEEMNVAGQPLYEKAIVLLEGAKDPSRYTSDAKEIYNYLGNFYLGEKNVEKAKEFFNKYLTLDPNNEDYRKFVESLK